MNRLKHILQHRYLFKILAIIILISSIIITNTYKKESIYNGTETEFQGIIYKKQIKDNKIVYYLKGKEKLVINDYNLSTDDINLGDFVLVTGILKVPENNTVPNLFNYKKYLYNNNIFYTVTCKSIKKISNNTNILYYIKNKINNRINNIYRSNEYIKIFILGDTSSLDENILKSYRENGVSHLFSISGMHISLFASLILVILKRISYNNYYNYSIVIFFLIIYLLLVGATPSVVRSVVMYILFSLNKIFNLKIHKIDIMCIVLIIMLNINPYYIYNISFQYSYLISFSLVLYSNKIKQIKNKYLKTIYLSLISFLVSFPICIYNFYQVNIFSIILNIFLIPLVSCVIFPLSLLSFIFPKISYVLSIFTTIFQTISLFITKYQIGIITFSKPGIILIIIYYLFIFLFLYNKLYFYIFILMFVHKIYIYMDPIFEVTIFDVGQGDSILIKFPYNQGNILIDSSGLINSDYSNVENKIIPYLKSMGINKLNYLILTHGDYDHMGESVYLVENFKVDKVIFNCGDMDELEQKLIDVLENDNIQYYSCIKELNISEFKLYFLNTSIYDNENDNSNVIYFNYNNYKFLFMGDASKVREQSILEKYNLSNIDFLKVGHHGSDTSSSKDFIDTINSKYSLISVGKNNSYGHPKESVLDILSNSKVYRTDIDGSIVIKLNKRGYKISNFN